MTLALLVTVGVFAQVVPPASLGEANGLRDALRAQLDSIETIECSYTFCCNLRAHERLDQVQLRWKGGWLWYASRPNGPSEDPDAHNVVMEAIVNGAVSGYWDKSNVSGRYRHTNYESLRFMSYNELSPLTVLGISSPHSYYSYVDALRGALTAPGSPYAERRDNKVLLYLYSDPPDGDYSSDDTSDGTIVYFDDEGRVVQVDYVLRPPCSLAEVALLSGSEAPRDIYGLFVSDVFADYHDVDGYSLPTRLHRTLYKRSVTDAYISHLQSLQQKFDSGLITLCEHLIEIYRTVPGYEAEKEWNVSINPDSIRINNPGLTRADFDIVPPQTPTVTWDIASGDFVDEFGAGNYDDLKKADEARRIQRMRELQKKDYTLPIGVALGAISIVILVTAIILKIKGAR